MVPVDFSRMIPPRILFVMFTLLFSSSLYAQRHAEELTDGWKFLKADALPRATTDTWENVTVPHTWNVEDGCNGKAADPQYPEGYYRGPGWYARPLDVPVDWKGKRVFIRFEGVSLVADVFVNEVAVGQHRGAFAAFCFEITPYLHFDGKDTLRVRADNARAFDVAPLSGDFTVFGGIYRPVHVFATDDVCISPLEFASPGVFLTLKELRNEQATIEAKTLVSNGVESPASAKVEVEIKDATGASVSKQEREMELPAGKTTSVVQQLSVANPHLWNGRKDPYLYSATIRVSRDGKVVDEIVQPLGIRTVAITEDRGFVLNGQPYPLHGVNRHQDRAGKGWALTNADQDEDHAMIEEIGATTVRLAHYQQADYFHSLSDRDGIIEWQEIPLVETLGGSPEFLANARQQLTEMILQTYNHPAACMWGLFNELDATWAEVHTAEAAPIIADLQKLARSLDSTRPTVAASWPQDAGPRHKIPDWTAWNIYPGWYSAYPQDASGLIDKYSGQMGKRIGLAEYGAGANPAQFQEGEPQRPVQAGPFHPQEWQNYAHERMWAQFRNNPKLWGTWIWAMFDFAVDKRDEGSTPGINDKGLVTRDRKIRKDTFYFYKANWNPEPMVYLVSRRMTPRKQAITEVKVYSNCAAVELKVNGQSIGSVKPDDDRICRWKFVQLKPGTNDIEAIGYEGCKEFNDTCTWVLEP